VTSGNVLIPIKTAVRTSDIANLKPINFVFRFLAHKGHRVWGVFQVTLCLFTFILKKNHKTNQCLHLGTYWKNVRKLQKHFPILFQPSALYERNLKKPTSTTSVLCNPSYHVPDPLVYIGLICHLLHHTANTCKYWFIDGWVNKGKLCTKINSNRNCVYLLRTKTVYQWHRDLQRVLRKQTQTQEKNGFLTLQRCHGYHKGRPVLWTFLYPTSFFVYLFAL